jgi:hypothetical protein
LSVGPVTSGEVVVVLAAGEVVVVAGAVGVVAVVPGTGELVVVPGTGELVVVVVGGRTKDAVSPSTVARLAVGVADRSVQLRAAFQDCRAAAAGVPVRGCGSPLTMVAGRKVDPRTRRPSTVMRSTPLSVSGAVSS